ncbi:tRNA threonylcarbamoyladenosine dehydratase [Riemerella anatipestifer]|uniref:tRNA threonylcarbamoyladenosine dehydratase n=1 Tax=Riemerella anatipestifer TaxID=34085 RepID=A0A1S7DSR5_RIEAN|nr:tRNA threonylcarbamoyladenosine dehydratase [Riemerella anatipestifer]AQY22163.1 tRNA threonylcarbamoyladenosine dehydratase [Riemerella anatipestifer]MCO4303883.1 tRNA threonylcarbamoyladenosine dehydratase [Riemerella anatipestifer]MCO7352748.1 tRNA threonylcarbamoyladenosine dehydratase [Riemerella anatipestifer]MCQ4039361.1 tRNA threonylcarbamoyladenosine dehydratase [Riemerella anatipestifer]MCT6760852.1 tRNA threonylcarbamoyladenosine dehydratase [Riemerella anatipestifer]
MTNNWLERTELLIKQDGLNKLQNANILVVGLGGVGSFAAEFLARAGVGKMTIIDGDTVDITNINRQLPALHSTVNQPKVELVYARLKDINPNLDLTAINEFLTPERMEAILTKEKFDYILDCIDSVSPKLSLILTAKRNKIKIVSAMGAGGKTDPSKVMVRDISKTNNCFLAKQIRKRLRKEKINKGIKCVFSTELQKEDSLKMTDGSNFKKSFYGTISFMPALFGLHAAAEVINYFTKKDV